MKLPSCRWRGPQHPSGRYTCSSPNLLVTASGVTAAVCSSCPYADLADAMPANDTAVAACQFLGRRVRNPDGSFQRKSCFS